MPAQSLGNSLDDSFLVLDEEFDRGDMTLAAAGYPSHANDVPHDDLAWEDQLDRGEEIGL